jgi:hypothetical protein
VPELWKTHRTRFPQARWTAHRTRRPQPSTRHHRFVCEKEERKTDYNDVLSPRRLIKQLDALASLRSDHDALDSVITMVWTK